MFDIMGEDLRNMRLSVGKTTKEMAKKAGVSRVTYENWETGVGEPRMNQFLDIGHACSLSLAPLFKQISTLRDQFNQRDENETPQKVRKRASKKFKT
ncbi:helix-turn-helix transcriptional regulator [Thalassomonas actiniarum]|uniref:Helix-turn-helix transcriptional regulator n=1 Tax=Thalassomonas actiniarum TaxID=485447 RepID=A0AAF0C4Q7_9GAMM|nr:helix-turn-helix transcriptional regulator [Thalassomonas actiniarum]WDE02547.1 helix-turn-helix transcriptional regulator [Thalassomonas actiniarum]